MRSFAGQLFTALAAQRALLKEVVYTTIRTSLILVKCVTQPVLYPVPRATRVSVPWPDIARASAHCQLDTKRASVRWQDTLARGRTVFTVTVVFTSRILTICSITPL